MFSSFSFKEKSPSDPSPWEKQKGARKKGLPAQDFSFGSWSLIVSGVGWRVGSKNLLNSRNVSHLPAS